MSTYPIDSLHHRVRYFLQTFRTFVMFNYQSTTLVNTSQNIDREGRSIETPYFSDNDTLEVWLRIKNIYKNISAPNVAQHFFSILHFKIIVSIPMWDFL